MAAQPQTPPESTVSPLLISIQCAARDAKEAPKPATVDEFSLEYDRLKQELKKAEEQADAAKKPVDVLKLELIELVRRFGGSHAEKSKLLHGIDWEMMATFGQSMQQDAAAIERLRVALKKSGKTRLLKKLFTEEKRWAFSTNAMTLVKGEKLTPSIMSLLLKCFVPSDNTPRLDVRPKKKVVA
jgi:hypothetical protein